MLEDDKIKELQEKLAMEGKKSFVTKQSTFESAIKTNSPNTSAPETPTDHSSILKKLRTFESDAAETIQREKASAATIAIAEKKRKEEAKKAIQQSNTAKNNNQTNNFFIQREHPARKLLTILSVVLIFGGLAIIGVFYYLSHNTTPPPVEHTYKTIIPADKNTEISSQDLDEDKIKSQIETIRKSADIANNLVISVNFPSKQESDSNVEFSKFIELINIDPPAQLARSFGDNFMFGFHSVKGKPMFLLISISSFDNAFPGMLEWESELYDQLDFIRPIEDDTFVDEPTTASTTEDSIATSTNQTSTITPETEIKTTFEDYIIKNKDTRVLRTTTGEIVLLYSFLDRQTLVITTNESTFDEILSRYKTTER